MDAAVDATRHRSINACAKIAHNAVVLTIAALLKAAFDHVDDNEAILTLRSLAGR